MSYAGIAVSSASALIALIAIIGLGLLLAGRIRRLLGWFGGTTQAAVVALALALLVGGIAEASGLALIVGSYSFGLALSGLDMSHAVHRRLGPVQALLVPVFFCQMGMMLDVGSLGGAVWLGVALTAVGTAGKMIGCGLPALAFGFNLRGALRIGLGMVPRGEVALIAAGIALHNGYLGQQVFAAAIIMTFATTVIGPALLGVAFGSRPGTREARTPDAGAPARETEIDCGWEDVAELVAERVAGRFRHEGYYVYRHWGTHSYVMRLRTTTAELIQAGTVLKVRAPAEHSEAVAAIVDVELGALRSVFHEASSADDVRVRTAREGPRGERTWE